MMHWDRDAAEERGDPGDHEHMWSTCASAWFRRCSWCEEVEEVDPTVEVR